MKNFLVFCGMGIWLFADIIVEIPEEFKKIFSQVIDIYNTAYYKSSPLKFLPLSLVPI